jgi:hypothetical protein
VPGRSSSFGKEKTVKSKIETVMIVSRFLMGLGLIALWIYFVVAPGIVLTLGSRFFRFGLPIAYAAVGYFLHRWAVSELADYTEAEGIVNQMTRGYVYSYIRTVAFVTYLGHMVVESFIEFWKLLQGE